MFQKYSYALKIVLGDHGLIANWYSLLVSKKVLSMKAEILQRPNDIFEIFLNSKRN